jgi:hypothetical protein
VILAGSGMLWWVLVDAVILVGSGGFWWGLTGQLDINTQFASTLKHRFFQDGMRSIKNCTSSQVRRRLEHSDHTRHDHNTVELVLRLLKLDNEYIDCLSLLQIFLCHTTAASQEIANVLPTQ